MEKDEFIKTKSCYWMGIWKELKRQKTTVQSTEWEFISHREPTSAFYDDTSRGKRFSEHFSFKPLAHFQSTSKWETEMNKITEKHLLSLRNTALRSLDCMQIERKCIISCTYDHTVIAHSHIKDIRLRVLFPSIFKLVNKPHLHKNTELHAIAMTESNNRAQSYPTSRSTKVCLCLPIWLGKVHPFDISNWPYSICFAFTDFHSVLSHFGLNVSFSFSSIPIPTNPIYIKFCSIF